ncbi:MAG: chromosomal replication initiator protein DnaA [Bacteriovoracaceae bacterium]|nr:chromosomal replication initiator protein DnaA [Bacteriovoracaceae bacterium]
MNDNFPIEHFINFKNIDNNKEKTNNIKNLDSFKQTDSTNNFGSDEMQSITDEILTILSKNINPQKFNAFFKNTFNVASIGPTSIDFNVTTEFIKKMINNYYLDILSNCVEHLMGSKYDISINVIGNSINNIVDKSEEVVGNFASNLLNQIDKISSESKKESNNNNLSFNINNSIPTNEVFDQVESKELEHLKPQIYGNIQDSKNFDNFIVGPSNNMAHAFSLAVAKSPGEIYPQLYLYGNSGLGKTHLLHAICNHIKNNKPQTKICLITANDFTKEMVASIQSKSIDQFKRKYTDLVDVLIIDDIHELKNRTRTQAEFIEIFNELKSKKKQLIFTSDKPPKEIDGIEDRIRTRLSSALLIDIKQPDLETRIAILKKKAIERDIFISDDVITLIASCVKTNVRELEGKLIRLGAFSDLMNVDIDLEIAKEQLGISDENQEKIITIDLIAKTVAKYFKLPLGDIRGKTRKAELVLARHIAMYMAHKNLKKTLEEIGDYFDKRDHSTVIHAIDKINNKIKEDTKIQQQIFEIESDL